MSTAGMSVASSEYDAAQALLDLHSNIRESKHEKSDSNDSIETAKLFLSCFISSNNQPGKASTSSKVYAVATSTTTKSDVVTTRSSKRKTPDQELTRARHNDTNCSEETSKKYTRMLTRKPIKHFTVTSASASATATDPAPSFPATKDNMSKVSETKIKTRSVGTQTEDKDRLTIIETMEFTISKLFEKVKSLEEQIKSNSQVMDTVDHDVSNNANVDANDAYKVNSHKMTIDDSNASDSERDETLTDRETPVKVKTKDKAGQFNKYNNTTRVLSNRNVNANADGLVPIGDGNALIPSRIFRHVNWNSYTNATRKLLTAVFTRRTLATHSLTGKPSPAFPNKPAKKKLDPALVNDIVQTVVERCCVPENVVRTSITTKCADESKMFRTRENNKKKRKPKVNTENIPPGTDSDEF